MSDNNQLTEFYWYIDILQNVDVGLVVLDREFQVHLWNGFMENHSGKHPNSTKQQNIFQLFPEIDEARFRSKAESVYQLKSSAFSSWEQRPYLFKFKNYRPITCMAPYMYQNTTIIPLVSTTGDVNHICIIVYDVTEEAVYKLNQEKQQPSMQVVRR